MRRNTMIGAAGAVLALSITTVGAGQAFAQTPQKYGTKSSCEAAARKLDREGEGPPLRSGHFWYPQDNGEPCSHHPGDGPGQKWWLYPY